MTTGADALLGSLEAEGVTVCFANPGTTELDFVRAFERHPKIRCVVGLQENVCTGAADGYGRMRGRPAATLLHLGPGFANGIANLHNARRAHTPIVNLIGDHASWHLAADAPLTSDIVSLAHPVSGWVHRVASVEDMAPAGANAVSQSLAHGGQGATLIVPADYQAAALDPVTSTRSPSSLKPATAASSGVAADLPQWVQRLRAARKPLFLLGGGGPDSGLGERGQRAVARLCTLLGGTAYAETFPARAERGAGLPDFDRLPYFPEPARAVLDVADLVILAGALPPVTYFGYDGHPSFLVEPQRLLTLATPGLPVADALEALADALGAAPFSVAASAPAAPADGALTPHNIGAALSHDLPAQTIVSVEGGTCGYPFYAASANARRHTALTNTGGAIGQGLPVALGAAIAEPDRQVVALVSDGSTQYTVQALWSMAHENARVVVLVAANHQYAILRNELRRGNAPLGERAAQMTGLDNPRIDWVRLAEAYGVPARRAATVSELRAGMAEGFARSGPLLIEMQL